MHTCHMAVVRTHYPTLPPVSDVPDASQAHPAAAMSHLLASTTIPDAVAALSHPLRGESTNCTMAMKYVSPSSRT